MLSLRCTLAALALNCGAATIQYREAALEGANLRGAGCRIVYLDVGSNKGDSIESFIRHEPQEVAGLLEALPGGWSPATSCVQGFEPNPRWTARLRQLQARLGTW